MTFAKAHRGRELATIVQILAIFGTVEQRQLRKLFGYLSDYKYGKVLSVLQREGLAYLSADGKYISNSRYSMDFKTCSDTALAFWVFIYFRNKIGDFCASDPPSILTFSAEDKNYDLIPGSPDNIPAINTQADTVHEDTVRFIVVKDKGDARALVPRLKNDYLVLVGSDGVKQIYQL